MIITTPAHHSNVYIVEHIIYDIVCDIGSDIEFDI